MFVLKKGMAQLFLYAPSIAKTTKGAPDFWAILKLPA